MTPKNRSKFGWIFLLLLSIVTAEVIVLYITDSVTQGILTSFQPNITSVWKWTYGYVGPVLFPLIILTLIYFYTTLKLIQTCFTGYINGGHQRFYKSLKVIETIAPAFGFLGTTLSLVNVMAGIDPSLSQSGMLKSLLTNSASAFGSTVYGIVLSITAYLTVQVFENFLLAKDRISSNEFEEVQEGE